MIRRLVLATLAMVPCVSWCLDAHVAAVTEAVKSQTAKIQVQAQSSQIAPGTPESVTNPPETTEHAFEAAPYLALSLGPRDVYTGLPFAYKGFDVAVSGGVATLFGQKWYMAGEIFVGESVQLKNFSNFASLKPDWTYGFDVIPGYLVTRRLLGYLRLGVANTCFARPYSGTTAWRLGIGGEAHLYKGWDLRGEYVYNGYKRVNIGRPGSDQFNLGILYKFA